MNKALGAKSIGDKLYQLERIHSKLIHLINIDGIIAERKDNNDLLILEAVKALGANIKCFNNNRSSKVLVNYINCIDSILHNLNANTTEPLFSNFCHLNSVYIKFRRKHKKMIVNSCEYDYQEVCMPLFILDSKFIKQR